MEMKALYVSSSLSYRVNTRRNCLILRKFRSTTFRPSYNFLSYFHGRLPRVKTSPNYIMSIFSIIGFRCQRIFTNFLLIFKKIPQKIEIFGIFSFPNYLFVPFLLCVFVYWYSNLSWKYALAYMGERETQEDRIRIINAGVCRSFGNNWNRHFVIIRSIVCPLIWGLTTLPISDRLADSNWKLESGNCKGY